MDAALQEKEFTPLLNSLKEQSASREFSEARLLVLEDRDSELFIFCNTTGWA